MKRLLTTVLAAAVALTAVTANPAAALDKGERQRLLLGLTALAIIGGALSASGGSKSSPPVSHGPGPYYPIPEPPRGGGYGHGDWGRNYLPSSCQFQVRTREGVRNVLGSRCLQDNRIAVNRLPSRCEFTVRTNRGPRDVFGAGCLRNEGYRIEARR